MTTYINGEEVDCGYYEWYWEVCCDCGLAHYVAYSKKNKDAMTKKVFRDAWKTEELRMEMTEKELKNTIRNLQRILRKKRRAKKEADSGSGR